jgi:hypothetical protein
MLRNRPAGGIRERGHAEIRQLASLKAGSALNQCLCLLVDAEAKALTPQTLNSLFHWFH